jgi:hypothetical protein
MADIFKIMNVIITNHYGLKSCVFIVVDDRWILGGHPHFLKNLVSQKVSLKLPQVIWSAGQQ